MARKKLPPELKAKNHTFKLYDWEVEIIKDYIRYIRISDRKLLLLGEVERWKIKLKRQFFGGFVICLHMPFYI